MKRWVTFCGLITIGLMLTQASQAETIVYPNVPTGETYTNASGINQGQAGSCEKFFALNLNISDRN
ncbi:MAG: hypothetical protein KJZ70_12610, partial [Bryobacterales bacterium]|nr:hypothetical protein [Bryobacterales bacterium]